MTATAELDRLIREGLESDIYQAERAYQFMGAVSIHAAAINNAGFGGLFGAMAHAMGSQYAISVSKVFEKPSKRYPNRSLRSIAAYLESRAVELQIRDRAPLNGWIAEPIPSSDPDLTRLFACRLCAGTRVMEASRAFASIKDLRDKLVAHNEVFDAASAYKAEFSETQELLAFAKRATDTLGRTYLVEWPLGDFASRVDEGAALVGGALERLLREAGVLRS